MYTILIQIYESISKEYSNLYKNKTRPRSLENIDEKTKYLTDLFNKYKLFLNKLQPTFKSEQWNSECEKYEIIKQKYTAAIKILEESVVLQRKKPSFKTLSKTIILCRRLSRNNSKIKFKTIVKLIIICGRLAKMPKVDIKLGTSLVHVYDGTPENLNAFLDAVALFSDTVDEEYATATQDQKTAAKETLFKFVKTRLTGVARQSIIGTQNLADTLDKIKIQCSPKFNSDNVKAKLSSLKQKGSIEEFCEQVEKLTQRLAITYIDENIPADKANQMATKTGVESLINGTDHHDSKIILKAGTFSKINDAIQKLQENYSSKSTNAMQAQIYMANRSQTHRGRGRGGRFNNFRGNSMPNRAPGRWQNFNYGHSNFQSDQNRYNRQRVQWNPRGQWNNRGQGNHRGRPSIYLMQPNPQMMNTLVQQQHPPQLLQQHSQQPILPNQNFPNNQTPMTNQNFLGTQFGR